MSNSERAPESDAALDTELDAGLDALDLDLVSGADAARMLGVKPSRIKQLVRDRLLVARRSGGHWQVPAAVLIELDSPMGQEPTALKLASRIADSVRLAEDEEPLPAATHVPLWSLPGTLTVLADAGFSDEQALSWLFSFSPELDARPIDAVLEGKHHRVNSVASALGW